MANKAEQRSQQAHANACPAFISKIVRHNYILLCSHAAKSAVSLLRAEAAGQRRLASPAAAYVITCPAVLWRNRMATAELYRNLHCVSLHASWRITNSICCSVLPIAVEIESKGPFQARRMARYQSLEAAKAIKKYGMCRYPARLRRARRARRRGSHKILPSSPKIIEK